MWNLDVADLEDTPPADQLWVVAQAIEEYGGPRAYVVAVRRLAGQLETIGWWLAEAPERSPLERP